MKKFKPGDLVTTKDNYDVDLWAEPWDYVADPEGSANTSELDAMMSPSELAIVVATHFYKGKKQEVYVITESHACGWVASMHIKEA